MSKTQKCSEGFATCTPMAREKLLRTSIFYLKTVGAQSASNNPWCNQYRLPFLKKLKTDTLICNCINTPAVSLVTLTWANKLFLVKEHKSL